MLRISALIFFVFLLIACESYPERGNSPVIASTEIGDIHLDKFIEDYQSFLDFTGVEDNLLFRKGLLRSEIDRLFILNYADETGFDENPANMSKLQSISGQTLLNEYYEREIAGDFPISDDLIREAFRRSKIKLHARHLYAKSREEAETLKNRLERGETFEELAKEVFDTPQLAENGGDLGYFSFDDMDPSFEDAAYALKDGEISDPVKTAKGYSIIQVLDRTYDPIITEYDYQLHKDDFKAAMKRRLLKTEVKKITREFALKYTPDINSGDLQRLYNSFPEILESEDNIPDEIEDIHLVTGNTRWGAQDICSHLRETTVNQQKQVESPGDLLDMLTGLCIRSIIFKKIENADWRRSEDVLQKLKDATEQRTIKLLLENVYNQSLTEGDTLDQKEIYLSFVGKLKNNKMIKIDRQLLKSFRL